MMTMPGAPYPGDGHVFALVGSQPVQVQGAAHLYSGNGAPGATAPTSAGKIGDLYLRTDGGVGSTLYVCRGGASWSAIA